MPRAVTAKQQGRSDIEPIHEKSEIGILLYSGAKPAVVLGLTDLFEVANQINSEHAGGSRTELMISHWGTDESSESLQREHETHPGKHGKPDCLVFPIGHDSLELREFARETLSGDSRGI